MFLFMVSLWLIIITQERILTPSPSAAAVEVIWGCADVSFISQFLLKNEQITLHLTIFYIFIGKFVNEKIV